MAQWRKRRLVGLLFDESIIRRFDDSKVYIGTLVESSNRGPTIRRAHYSTIRRLDKCTMAHWWNRWIVGSMGESSNRSPNGPTIRRVHFIRRINDSTIRWFVGLYCSASSLFDRSSMYSVPWYSEGIVKSLNSRMVEWWNCRIVGQLFDEFIIRRFDD